MPDWAKDLLLMQRAGDGVGSNPALASAPYGFFLYFPSAPAHNCGTVPIQVCLGRTLLLSPYSVLALLSVSVLSVPSRVFTRVSFLTANGQTAEHVSAFWRHVTRESSV